MITNYVKIERRPLNFYHAVVRHVRQCQKKIFFKNMTHSHHSIGKHRHQEEVGAGGHPPPLASNCELNLIRILSVNHQFIMEDNDPKLKSKIF